MLKGMKRVIFIMAILLITGACSRNTSGSVETPNSVVTSLTVTKKPVSGVKPVSAVLKASVFKMSGDYSDNVAIGIGADGKLTYFPAPSDIDINSAPVSLGDGWWLNRQGLGKGYRFTRYTFEEYSKLPEVPSMQELLDAVIPGAVVTEIRMLDIPAPEAMDRIEEIKTILDK